MYSTHKKLQMEFAGHLATTFYFSNIAVPCNEDAIADY
jgi:hypothetical protein